MNIVKFAWGETFAVDGNFDLNHLKQFMKVKESNKIGYIPVDNTITIELGKIVEFNPNTVEKINIDEITENRDYYQNQYWKLQEELKTISSELKIANTALTHIREATAETNPE